MNKEQYLNVLYDSQGFDEFMNVVLDEAEEVWQPKPATEKRAAMELTKKPMGELGLCTGHTIRSSDL